MLVLVPGRRRQLPPFGRRRRWAGGGAPLLGLRLGSEPAWPKCSKTQWKCILFWAYHSVTISDLGVPFSHVSRKNIFQSLEKRSFTGEILQFTRAGNYTQKPLQNAYGLHDFLTIPLKKHEFIHELPCFLNAIPGLRESEFNRGNTQYLMIPKSHQKSTAFRG